MKKAVIVLVLTAILTSVMAPVIYASPSADQDPKHFELSQPVKAFLKSEGLTVVSIDKDGNYILRNNEFGYQALMTKAFAESLGTGSGDVSVMVTDPNNPGRIWDTIERAYLVYCLVKEFIVYCQFVARGRGDEYISTTMQWFPVCDIINGVIYWY